MYTSLWVDTSPVSWDNPFAYFSHLTARLWRRAEPVLKAGMLFTCGDHTQGTHATSDILWLVFWALPDGRFGLLRPGPSVGFPFGSCFWRYWQWWVGSFHHCGRLGLSPGDLRPVSPLRGEGAREWGVYPLISPLPPPLAELCSPGRQVVNLQALWLIPAMG